MPADRPSPDDDAPDDEDEGDPGGAALDGRLWFLRDPAALAKRFVLAEILAEPRGRGQHGVAGERLSRRRG
jgi:hypothetical protein